MSTQIRRAALMEELAALDSEMNALVTNKPAGGPEGKGRKPGSTATMRKPRIYVEYNGERRCLADWCRTLGLKPMTVYMRWRSGIRKPDVLFMNTHLRLGRIGQPKLYTDDGRTMSAEQWAAETGLSVASVKRKAAIGEPLVKKRRGHRGRLVTHAGRTMNLTDWAKELEITCEALRQRLAAYPVDVALSKRESREAGGQPNKHGRQSGMTMRDRSLSYFVARRTLVLNELAALDDEIQEIAEPAGVLEGKGPQPGTASRPAGGQSTGLPENQPE
jgi:hypothetical protein